MDDNVVEMQKTITTMVQKQVEKEKSMWVAYRFYLNSVLGSRKRRERSLLSSVPREIVNAGADFSLEIKQEMLSGYENEEVQKSASGTPAPILQKVSTPDISKTPTSSNSKVQTPEKMESTLPRRELSNTPVEERTFNPVTEKDEVISCSGSATNSNGVQVQENPDANQKPQPTILKMTDYQVPLQGSSLTATNYHKGRELNDCVIRKEPAATVQPMIPVPASSTAPAAHLNGIIDNSILQHLPERVVKKLNQPNYTDQNLLLAHKRLTGIDPIVADSEAVLLPHYWSRQMVMRGLGGSNHYVSPTTSRQSSETDSSSSEANKRYVFFLIQNKNLFDTKIFMKHLNPWTTGSSHIFLFCSMFLSQKKYSNVQWSQDEHL